MLVMILEALLFAEGIRTPGTGEPALTMLQGILIQLREGEVSISTDMALMFLPTLFMEAHVDF